MFEPLIPVHGNYRPVLLRRNSKFIALSQALMTNMDAAHKNWARMSRDPPGPANPYQITKLC